MSERATNGRRTGETMTTNRLPWPRDAQHARDESAEAANEIIMLLSPLMDTDGPEYDLYRALGRAIDRAHRICRLLEREGAQTIPTPR